MIDLEGHIVAIGQREYTFDIPKIGWAEQDPDAWWQAVISATHDARAQGNLNKDDIIAIGLSGQMHGLVSLDRGGESVRKAILWCDQRSIAEVEYVRSMMGNDALGRITHSPVATGFLLPSLLWVRNHEPEVFARISSVILPKDYVRFKMTGFVASEITDAAATSAFDCGKREWSETILQTFHLDPSLFPSLGVPEAIAGALSVEAAGKLGLESGIPVAYGGADQVMQSIGNGVTKSGTALVTIGTGGQVLMPLDHPAYDRKLRSHGFSFVEGKTYYMGATLASGLSLRWARSNMAPELSYKEIDTQALRIPAGSEGLVFLPYLAGERTPAMDPQARGVFFGLTLRHTRIHLLRAVMEGVCFSLKDCLGILERDMGEAVTTLVASGGGSQSKLWVQIQADILGRAIHTSKMKEQSGVGAAITAGVASGTFSSFEDAFSKTIVWNDEPTQPNPQNIHIYEHLYVVYQELYQQTKELMWKLSEEENEHRLSPTP
jgi:xylulokinase